MSDEGQTLPVVERRPARDADWLSRAELAALTPADLVSRTTALKPLAAAHAAEAERLRRPVDEVWNAIRRTGAFYHFVPKAHGGLEFDVDTFIDAMLPLAEGCSSTGWVAAFCVEHNWMLAQFPGEAQAEIFATHPYIIAPGVTTPPGVATPVKGGYRLTGRWRWGTGVTHADWIIASGVISADGPPQVALFVFPAEEAVVLDTWRVDGMAGTGSHDISAHDIFVPEHRSVRMSEMREGRAGGALLYENPIYSMPMLPFLALTAAIPALGTARAVVDHFRGRMNERFLYLTDVKHAEKPATQMRLADADLRTRTAELLLRDAGRQTLALGARGDAPVNDRISIRAQIAYAMKLCREAIQVACEGAGSSAHFLTSPLQRALRDINVMSSHVVYDLDAAQELHGRALIGLPPNSPLV